MASQRQGQVGRFNTQAIVANPDQLATAGIHLDIHPGGAGVQAVFQYFLGHGGRAFDHLTGCNLVGQPGAE